jgi:hypothetical protein
MKDNGADVGGQICNSLGSACPEDKGTSTMRSVPLVTYLTRPVGLPGLDWSRRLKDRKRVFWPWVPARLRCQILEMPHVNPWLINPGLPIYRGGKIVMIPIRSIIYPHLINQGFIDGWLASKKAKLPIGNSTCLHHLFIDHYCGCHWICLKLGITKSPLESSYPPKNIPCSDTPK